MIAITVTGVTLARAELYRYVDENGRAHYTNDRKSVPPRYRKRTREMSENLWENRPRQLPRDPMQFEAPERRGGTQRTTCR